MSTKGRKYGSILSIIAVFAVMVTMLSGVSAVSMGNISIDGMTEGNMVNANSADITISAVGTDINQTVIMGGQTIADLIVLETYDYTGTNTSIEETYTYDFPARGDYVVRLCILDGDEWNNQTTEYFTVAPYVIPFANNVDSTYNIVAFAVAIIFVFALVWFILMRNDKTNKVERKEIRKDVIIAFIVAVIGVLCVFLYLGGGFGQIYDLITGCFDTFLGWFGL